MTERIQKQSNQENKEHNTGNDNLLLLFNDDIHSFDYVIESLVTICKHSTVQAEQCTTIAHYKGVCEIKKGDYQFLKEMHDGLTEKGLKAEIK